MILKLQLPAVAFALLLSPALSAEVTASGEHGFTVHHAISSDKDPFTVYRTMTSHVDQWWSGDHSWSGDASNLYMEIERGGCFCEKLPGGGNVEHLRLIYFAPGKELRFHGALGPLQTMGAQGLMIWKIEKTDTGSEVSFNYRVTGHPEGGLGAIAPAVDQVIGEQIRSLGDRLGWE